MAWKIAAPLLLVAAAACASKENGSDVSGGARPSGDSGASGAAGVPAAAGGGAGGSSGGAVGGAAGVMNACGPHPLRTAATAHAVSVGDDFVTASNTALFGLASMFDNTTGRFTSGPRWAWASAVEASISAYQRSGGALFPNLFVGTFELNRAGKFIDDLGYDDEGWWGAAWLRAYDVTGDPEYLAMAKFVFDDMATAWDETTCQGGMWWNRQSHYKNAITSELFYLLAAGLHRRMPGEPKYASWADKVSRWWSSAAFVNAAGLVQDGLTDACKGNGQTAWTYNQGVVLGALVEMYWASSNPRYLEDAKKLADASTSKQVTPGGILIEPCEAKGCDDNATSFKGIYQRYLAGLAEATGDAKYQAFLLQNARSVWKNAQKDGLFGVSWAGPFDEADAPRQASAFHALEAVTPHVTSFSHFVGAAGGLRFNHDLGFAAAPGGWGCNATLCPAAGVLQSGPFLSALPLGAHEARFRVSMNDPTPDGAPIVTLEVYDSASQSVVASRELSPSSFAAPCVAQTFGVPFVRSSALGPLELRVHWLAPANAPEVVVSDVAIDGEESFAAATLEHECGRLDAQEQLVSDRQHEPGQCMLARAASVSLVGTRQRVWFELGLAEFWGNDAAVAELSVLEAGAVVATRTLQRSDFKDGLLHGFNLDFDARAGHRYDFVVTRLAPADAPRLGLRAIYVRRAGTEESQVLPFDVRALGNLAGDGDGDGTGNVFPLQAFAGFTWPAASFTLGPRAELQNNALTSRGQALALKATSTRALHVLLLAVGGAQPNNVFSVAYTQGAAQTFERSLSDWVDPHLAPDENLAVSAAYSWSKTGKRYAAHHASVLTFPLDPSRTPTQLLLPPNPNLKILAVTSSE